MFPIFAGNSASTGYNLTRSLRFRASASGYLNRTPATTTNRQIFTWSGWVKLGAIGSANAPLFQGYLSSLERTTLGYQSDILYFIDTKSGTSVVLGTAAVYRDPSAWYHVVAAVDTTQATAANRTKIYINNVLQTMTGSYVTQNTNTYINANNLHYIGNDAGAASRYFDGYLTEVNFIDGQALTPSSFGSTNATTGVWQPARYTGTYGTNGFYLPFTDNSALTTSSNVGLGKDFSGNGNYWTTNNISITAGVTYDSMTDVPTLTSATAANFAVLNPLDSYSAGVSNGNLKFSDSSGTGYQTSSSISTPDISAYSFYCEVTVDAGYGVGIALASSFTGGTTTANTTRLGYYSNGQKFTSSTGSSYGATFTAGDVIGIAIGGGNITFYKNNTSQGVAFSSLTGAYKFYGWSAGAAGNGLQWNFGQQPFSYTPPTGYVALNTFNLPTSTIVKGNTVMDATLYTGTGSATNIVNAAGFRPDLVWDKSRSNAYGNKLYDSVRGAGVILSSNTTSAESTDLNTLSSFNSNGFGVGTDAGINGSGSTFVAWQWQAGQGSTSSNTNGTITSTVSVNASAGFSVVTYTGTGANATVGHGLGVAPSFIINKSRSAVISWAIYHSALTGTAGIFLDQATGAVTNSGYWNNTNPTSSVFSIGTSTLVNVSSQTQVAYCWAEIAGFSKFGIYTGNGSTDGVFVFTPFRPKFVIIKRTDTTGDWYTFDTSRDPYNATAQGLSPNSSAAEASYTGWGDLLSNGFKIRRTDAAWNASGATYIYMAFAENPFKNSLAR